MQRLVLACVFIVGIGLLGAGAGFYAGASRADIVAARLAASEASTASRLADIQDVLVALTADTDVLEATVAAEAMLRLDQAAETDALSLQFGTLQDDVTKQVTTLSASTDVTKIIKTWSPYVYALVCEFDLGEEELTEGKGSATLQRTENGVRFLTNKHVVMEDGAMPERCTMKRFDSDVEYIIEGSDIVLDEEEDLAWGMMPATVTGMGSWQMCAERPEIGDRLVILGYPAIGAKESITATEGIISGFDEVYYTTSAKIDRGHSGGAAIHMANNCYLGIPTMTILGRVEAIARILPVTAF